MEIDGHGCGESVKNGTGGNGVDEVVEGGDGGAEGYFLEDGVAVMGGKDGNVTVKVCRPEPRMMVSRGLSELVAAATAELENLTMVRRGDVGGAGS